jgi:hypothetical protein
VKWLDEWSNEDVQMGGCNVDISTCFHSPSPQNIVVVSPLSVIIISIATVLLLELYRIPMDTASSQVNTFTP